MWASIALLWRCLGNRAPEDLCHLFPLDVQFLPAGHVDVLRTLRGWAHEFGLLPNASREEALRCYQRHTSNQDGFRGCDNAIAAERVSVLRSNGLEPFLTLIQSSDLRSFAALATSSLCAATVARTTLTPLLGTVPCKIDARVHYLTLWLQSPSLLCTLAALQ